MKLLLICGCSVDGNENERIQGLTLLRKLRARGHDVYMLDLSSVPVESCQDLASMKEHFGTESLRQALELIKRSDAVLIISSYITSFIPQFLLQVSGFSVERNTQNNSYIWNQGGISCTILGGSVRRQKVAKELWTVLSTASYDRLDVSDILPFGVPRAYHCDPKLETATPCVM